MTGQQPIAGSVDRMIGFISHLRTNDFTLGPGETEAALHFITDHRWLPRSRAQAGLRILLTCRREEWDRFDALFEAYWQGAGRTRTRASSAAGGVTATSKPHDMWQRHLGQERQALRSTDRNAQREATDDQETEAEPGEGRLIASRQNLLQRTDLRHITDPEEIKDAERLALRLARAIRYRLSRRYRSDRQGRRPDLRRTIRANLSHGGDPLELFEKSRPERPVRLIVLLDVSGSMQPYSRFFLQFVKGLVCAWLETEAFLFHTRLVRVTDAVRDKDSVRAMSKLALMAQGFGGGTELAACLKLFNEAHAKRVLKSRSVVLILSDGYDTGEAAALADQLAKLKKRAPRLIWLNPLLGWRDYEPINKAMVAALPFIDHFAAAHSLDALAAIETDLAKL